VKSQPETQSRMQLSNRRASKILLVALLILAALAATSWYLLERNRERKTMEQINRSLTAKVDFGKRLATVRTTAAALAELEHPSVYVAIITEDVDTILKQQSETGIALEQVTGLSKLIITPGMAEIDDAELTIPFTFKAELKDMPISFAGAAKISSSLALNGSKADIYPLSSQIELTSLSYKRKTDRKIIVEVVSRALNGIL
jgi:hypothetical protein